jgi:hypothetical protein
MGEAGRERRDQPLTALLRVSNGALVEDDHARAIMEKLREAASVATALGVRLPYRDAGAQAEEVGAPHGRQSLCRCCRTSCAAPTEIDAIRRSPKPANGCTFRPSSIGRCGALVRGGGRRPGGASLIVVESLADLRRARPVWRIRGSGADDGLLHEAIYRS